MFLSRQKRVKEMYKPTVGFLKGNKRKNLKQNMFLATHTTCDFQVTCVMKGDVFTESGQLHRSV